jgi:hypothetical protein
MSGVIVGPVPFDAAIAALAAQTGQVVPAGRGANIDTSVSETGMRACEAVAVTFHVVEHPRFHGGSTSSPHRWEGREVACLVVFRHRASGIGHRRLTLGRRGIPTWP